MTEEKRVEAVTEWPKRDHGMTWEAWVVLTLGQVKREVDALKVGAAPLVILDSDANEAIVEETRKENADLRARCERAEAVTEELRLLRGLRGKLLACGSYSDWIAAAKEGAWMRIEGADAAFVAHCLAKLAALDALAPGDTEGPTP